MRTDVPSLQTQTSKKDLTPQPPPITATMASTTATAPTNTHTLPYMSHLSNDVAVSFPAYNGCAGVCIMSIVLG